LAIAGVRLLIYRSGNAPAAGRGGVRGLARQGDDHRQPLRRVVIRRGRGHPSSVQCIVLGSDKYGTQSVMGADVETYPTGNGSYAAIGRIEAYCQTGSGSTATELTCAQVDVSGMFANARPQTSSTMTLPLARPCSR
jgi:hypothetical protein